MLNSLDRKDIIRLIEETLYLKDIVVENENFEMLLNDVYIVNNKPIYRVKVKISKTFLDKDIELSNLRFSNNICSDVVNELYIVLTGLKNIDDSFVEVEYSCIYKTEMKFDIFKISKGLEKRFNSINDFEIIFDNDKCYIYTNIDLDFEFFDKFVLDLKNEKIILVRENQSNKLYNFTKYKNIYKIIEL